MFSNQHHLSVEIELGCGCVFKTRIAGGAIEEHAAEMSEKIGMPVPDDLNFPAGSGNLFGMLMSLLTPGLIMLLISDQHEASGNETIDIRVRTKVGELPRPDDWSIQ